jgi:hypothetical protein
MCFRYALGEPKAISFERKTKEKALVNKGLEGLVQKEIGDFL